MPTSSKRPKLETPELLELYKFYSEEEHKNLEAHQSRVSFFISLASALIATTVAGAFQASQFFHFVMIGLGPIILIAVCLVALKGADDFYRRFLISVTMRAKLERFLSLTDPAFLETETPADYWSGEALISPIHIKTRYQVKGSSADWVQSKLRTGYNQTARYLFTAGIILGVTMLLSLILLLSTGSYNHKTATAGWISYYPIIQMN